MTSNASQRRRQIGLPFHGRCQNSSRPAIYFPVAHQENASGVACPVKILFALSCEQSWTTLEKDLLQAH
jgi:hypothetical protein